MRLPWAQRGEHLQLPPRGDQGAQGVRRAQSRVLPQTGGQMRRSSRGTGMLTAIFENLPWIILALVLLGLAGVGFVVSATTKDARRDLKEIDAQIKMERWKW